MRRYKVEITRKGEVAHSCEVDAVSSEEAKDEAWKAFDPEQKVGILDTDYDSRVIDL